MKDRMWLSMILVAIAASFVAACSTDSDSVAETVAPTQAASVSTTTPEASTDAADTSACLGVFEQEWNAYGWEECVLGDAFAAGDDSWTLTENEAVWLTLMVWDQFGAGDSPRYESGSAAMELHCDNRSGGCAGRNQEGTRYVVFPDADNVDALSVLHEITHHLVGFDIGEIGGHHGMEFRCAAIEVYAAYAPSLVTDDDLLMLMPDVCGRQPALSQADCTLDDIRELAGAAQRHDTAEQRITWLEARRRGIQDNWQGTKDAKEGELAEIEAEMRELRDMIAGPLTRTLCGVENVPS